ncbi:MAG TPA: MBOAT family O-acyltransferase [Rhizobacter sp.]|nr:MBOAT family O-acyltransferase [Rhizobacter sp.]
MSDHLVDLAKAPFWLALVVAVILLAPLARGQHRSPQFALVNIGFIAVLLGWRGALVVLAGTALLWLLAQASRKTRHALVWTAIGGLLCGVLFILHKRPGLSAALKLEAVNPILAAIGFSYVALRAIELFRAMYEKAFEAPTFLETINFLLPFHMLAAGPIQAYEDFVAQKDRPAASLTPVVALEGLERIATGLFKKFVLAFAVQQLFLTDFTATGFYWFVEVQLFSIWLYIDFSAYSDIAVGIGKLLGVHTPENFNNPYGAHNLIVFWERWHISLSLWIRRNLFYPIQLALMRRTDGRHMLLCGAIGFGISFVLCGLWHGVAWNFVVWGAMHAVGLTVVNSYRKFLTDRLGSKGVKRYLTNPYFKWLGIAITFEYVVFSNLNVFYRY